MDGGERVARGLRVYCRDLDILEGWWLRVARGGGVVGLIRMVTELVFYTERMAMTQSRNMGRRSNC